MRRLAKMVYAGRRWLAVYFVCISAICVLAPDIFAQSPQQRQIILGGNHNHPVFAENFLTENPLALPSANFMNNIIFSRGTLATMFDSTGALTYAGNNLLQNSADPNTWNVVAQSGATIGANVTDPGGGNKGRIITLTSSGYYYGRASTLNNTNFVTSLWVKLAPGGVSQILVRNGVAGGTDNSNLVTLTSSWQNIGVVAVPSSGSYVDIGIDARVGVGGTGIAGAVEVAFGVIAAVTYETSPRPQDQVVTGATAYYGPAFDNVFGVPNSPLGLGIWEARTNVALWNRDLTNAAWTASNVTAAKNQTGVDGVANSASSITATAGNGTILQAITLASSAGFQTAYVKRLVGTGTIYMTMDGGTTWVDDHVSDHVELGTCFDPDTNAGQSQHRLSDCDKRRLDRG